MYGGGTVRHGVRPPYMVRTLAPGRRHHPRRAAAVPHRGHTPSANVTAPALTGGAFFFSRILLERLERFLIAVETARGEFHEQNELADDGCRRCSRRACVVAHLRTVESEGS